MKYPKINTLWERDKKGKIIEGQLCRKEFAAVKYWHITEKVDGTNIRIYFTNIILPGEEPKPCVEFKGRTDDAEIPKQLLEYLNETFTVEKMVKQFGEGHVILYGEGFGKGIQSMGKHYGDNQRFILFDAYINGWWLEQSKVSDLAIELMIPSVPDIGVGTLEEGIKMVKDKINSFIATDLPFEGIVARSYPLMLFRDGNPIMWKLKVKDFR